MSKYNRMNVYNGDPEPDCFGEIKGCLVPHCFWAKYCRDRSLVLNIKDMATTLTKVVG